MRSPAYSNPGKTKRCVHAGVAAPRIMSGIIQYDSTGNASLNLRFSLYLPPIQNSTAANMKLWKAEWMNDLTYDNELLPKALPSDSSHVMAGDWNETMHTAANMTMDNTE